MARGRRIVALTGAGCSTESGIPDYRGPGARPRQPLQHREFVERADARRRYWARSLIGWPTLAAARPNPAHHALAGLERAGILRGIVTQNVDGLHRAAGSRNVIEIHGEATRLRCLRCRRLEPVEPTHLEPGPVPACGACGAPLKPDLVLFEEPVRHLDAIADLVRRSEMMIVAGTSCEVAPASLLPEAVLGRDGSVVEMNLGPTPLTVTGLGRNGFFVQGPLGTTLPLLAARVLARSAAGGMA